MFGEAGREYLPGAGKGGTSLLEKPKDVSVPPDGDAPWKLILVDARDPQDKITLARAQVGSILDGPVEFIVAVGGVITHVYVEDDTTPLLTVPPDKRKLVWPKQRVHLNIGSEFDG